MGHKHKAAVASQLVAARKFEDKAVCLAEAERIAQRWEPHYSNLATQIRDQFEQTLAVHDLPSQHRRRVYTTNILERVMKEIKRRTRVVGIFPNESACDRLVGAQLLERHETWQCEPARYLCMERLPDDEPSSQPHSTRASKRRKE